jgi:RNA polymerase sigma factor (sigma-70 family)
MPKKYSIIVADFSNRRVFNRKSAMTETQNLLASFVRDGSESAFRELVTRYFDLVYSTAVRMVDGDTHRAKDIAQVVFADLAKMAGKLSENTTLGGWLHRHTCFVARNVMRGERRRQAREKQAVEMNALHDKNDSLLAVAAPILDEAINELGPDDRQAILLRFFERRSLRSVGEILGTTENVAQKRVARAVEELGTLLQRRGVALSAAGLASGLAAAAIKAAPAGLALTVASSVLSNLGSGANIGVSSAKALAMAKIKAAIAGALVVAAAFTIVLMLNNSRRNAANGNILTAGQNAQQAGQNLPASRNPTRTVAGVAAAKPRRETLDASLDKIQTSPLQFASTQSTPANAQVNTQSVSPGLVNPIVHLLARSGSVIRIAGTSSVHDWQAESPFIGGYLGVGPDFPLYPGQSVKPGAIPAQLEVFITTRSLKSVEKDGKPYSDAMDEVIYHSLKADQYRKITYRLLEMTFKQTTNFNDTRQYLFDTRGELAIAGVTNKITMPVYVQPINPGKAKIYGRTSVKMTKFHIEPPAPALARGLIKTGDDVDITFAWTLDRADPSTAQSQNRHTKPQFHFESESMIPAGSINFINTDLRQVLEIYASLAQAKIEMDETVKSLPVLIRFTNDEPVTKLEAIELLDSVLLEQAGIEVTHPKTNQVVMHLRQ